MKVILVKDYDWYLDGTLKTIIDPVATRTQTFDRNLTGKLTSWSQNTQTRSWSYDFNGNRKTQVISNGTETYDYPKEAVGLSYSGNRLKAISGATSKTFVYNANGNITSDGVYTYVYDGYGRLVSLQQSGVEKAHYDYNGLNQRVNKLVSGVNTQYSYDENAQLLGEYDASEKALQETVWLGDRPILARRTVGTVLKDDIIAADHLNTPRELIDWTSKKVVWRWDGEPYGSTLASDDPDADGTKVSYNLRFPGQVFDAESGLHYNQNRTYNPATGRYIQADPTGLNGGLNLYTYAEANPTLYVDPLGLMANKCDVPKGGTYVLRDESGEVVRSGRTKDFARRRKDHLRDPALKDYNFEAVHKTDVYAEQRGLEQVLHKTYNPPLNKIQPISPSNPRLPQYREAADRFLNGGS